MKYNISFINQRNTKIELFLGARPQNNEIVLLLKIVVMPKLELFPGARPPDTISTSWYDLTLGLVGSNRIMSTKHCAQRKKVFESITHQIKNYQNLYETLRARRCDTTSGRLIRLKPSGSIYIYIYVYTPTLTPNMAPNVGKHVRHGIHAVISYN